MARIPDIERRLNNWARWKLGSTGGLGLPSAFLFDFDSGRYREAKIPTNDCDADETDRAVASLEHLYRQTVFDVYIGSGSLARKASQLGVAIATIHARVSIAHQQLAAYFSERQRQARYERARVERLQRIC